VLSTGLVVLLCTEVIGQGVPDHGALHSECSTAIADVMAPPSFAVWPTWDAACQQHQWSVCNSRQGTAEPCHADICAWWHQACTLLNLHIEPV